MTITTHPIRLLPDREVGFALPPRCEGNAQLPRQGVDDQGMRADQVCNPTIKSGKLDCGRANNLPQVTLGSGMAARREKQRSNDDGPAIESSGR